jgi:probable rRNA maturation factor
MKKYQKIFESVLREENICPGNFEFSLSFVSESEIKKLNAKYRGQDKPTDVLSFPQFESLLEIQDIAAIDMEENEKRSLGDIVICEECDRKKYKLGADFLFVHSLLHLLGYDHSDEMSAKEERLRAEHRRRSVEAAYGCLPANAYEKGGVAHWTRGEHARPKTASGKAARFAGKMGAPTRLRRTGFAGRGEMSD